MYISHKSEDGRKELVRDHLREVAEMAADFARPFGGESWAYAAGMAHDIGKYSKEFQKRISGSKQRVDHSTAGAYELYKNNAQLLAYCVAGHHGGLPDGGSLLDTSDDATLSGRMKRAKEGRITDYHAFFDELEELPSAGRIEFQNSPEKNDGFVCSFLTRMLFSCLVDADFLCTERFVQGRSRETLSTEGLDVLSDRLEKKVFSFYPPESNLNKTRCKILDACADVAEEAPGVFSLTVPTGGGKTYASMRFALRHALAGNHRMRRVIYGVPYTSIIEQNAAVFRDVFGKHNVLEHHANFNFDDADEDGDLLRLATENWDAPVVVTTNVQLFESLYANRTSQCRKLHNIAGSVIVLDEAQMLPTKQLLPCIRVLAELVQRYGCSVVLCTATQPSLNTLFEKYHCSVREIAPDPQKTYERLRRVSYQLDGRLEDEEIASRLALQNQVLCVVNSRKQAKRLFGLVSAEVGEGAFHLSTLMHPVHRDRVLEEIRQRLHDGETCRVISTSLIEAGVDIDFPVAYRALAGVDSVVQCAGRCNREGQRVLAESVVHIFEPVEKYDLPADIKQKTEISRLVLQNAGVDICGGGERSYDISSLETIEAYFGQLHDLRKDRLDASEVLANLEVFSPWIPFRSTAERFHMIEEGSHSIVIPEAQVQGDVKAVEKGYADCKNVRRLARYSVGLYDNDMKALLKAGAIKALQDDIYLLLDNELYRNDIGLDVSVAGGRGIFH